MVCSYQTSCFIKCVEYHFLACLVPHDIIQENIFTYFAYTTGLDIALIHNIQVNCITEISGKLVLRYL